MEALFIAAGGLIPTAALVWLLIHPEVAEQWAALIGRGMSHVPGLWRRGSKAYLRHDTQRRINAFTRKMAADGGILAFERAEVEWVGDETDVGALAAEGKVIVRLSPKDQEDRGFIRGAYLFVCQSLLSTAKRVMTSEQCESLDIFAVRNLLRSEHPSLLDIFDSEVLHEGALEASANYYKSFAVLESRGLMWDVFVQELDILGQADMVNPTPSAYGDCVDGLLEFLVDRAQRPVGELVDCDYITDPFRLSLVYVGLSSKVKQGPSVWSRYIKARLVPLRVDSIYILSRASHDELVAGVAQAVDHSYATTHSAVRQYNLVKNGQLEPISGLIVQMRARVLASPAVARVLAGVSDFPISEPVVARPGGDTEGADDSSPAPTVLPEGYIRVSVSAALEHFGFLSSTALEGIYFKLEWISPLTLPLVVGQEGWARVVRSEDMKLFARDLKLFPHPVRWSGEVTSFDRGHGRINFSEDSEPCRFQLKDWKGNGRVRVGSRVSFIPILTTQRNYRATEVIEDEPHG